jgi:hypothetical protein
LRFGEKLSGSVQQRKRWDANMTPQERQIVETFMNLPPEKRKIVGEIVFALSKPYLQKSFLGVAFARIRLLKKLPFHCLVLRLTSNTLHQAWCLTILSGLFNLQDISRGARLR